MTYIENLLDNVIARKTVAPTEVVKYLTKISPIDDNLCCKIRKVLMLMMYVQNTLFPAALKISSKTFDSLDEKMQYVRGFLLALGKITQLKMDNLDKKCDIFIDNIIKCSSQLNYIFQCKNVFPLLYAYAIMKKTILLQKKYEIAKIVATMRAYFKVAQHNCINNVEAEHKHAFYAGHNVAIKLSLIAEIQAYLANNNA